MSSNDERSDDGLLARGASSAGLIAQPVVWVSLCFVATTGAGLPPGPFGLVGAAEGVSYLVVLALVARSLFRGLVAGEGKEEEEEGPNSGSIALAERLSSASLVAGILVLAGLVAQQGCVPNAKPILDYSDYPPVCQVTPGLFGN